MSMQVRASCRRNQAMQNDDDYDYNMVNDDDEVRLVSKFRQSKMFRKTMMKDLLYPRCGDVDSDIRMRAVSESRWVYKEKVRLGRSYDGQVDLKTMMKEGVLYPRCGGIVKWVALSLWGGKADEKL